MAVGFKFEQQWRENINSTPASLGGVNVFAEDCGNN